MSIVILLLQIKFIWEIIGFVKKCFACVYMCGVCMCIHICWGHRCMCRYRGLSEFFHQCMEAGSLTEPGALRFGYPACSRSSVSVSQAVRLHLSQFVTDFLMCVLGN